ncbi:MAG TPA: hypothetical protein PLB10_18750 [Thiolinea sp.]|nr:hypothetical protein [Thiolinea sp.]
MKYYKHPEFISSLHALHDKGGKYRKSADKVLAILAKMQEKSVFADKIIYGISLTKNGENRIQHCVKYDIGNGCRLVTVKSGSEQILLFSGTHEDTERWFKKNGKMRTSESVFQGEKDEILNTVVVDKAVMISSSNIESTIESLFFSLINESRKNKAGLLKRKENISKIRQDIKIAEAMVKESAEKNPEKVDIIPPSDSYNENDEISLAKNKVEKHDCVNILSNVKEIGQLTKEGRMANAIKIIVPAEQNLKLLRLRLEYIQNLESLVSERKSEMVLREKLKKLAIALDLESPGSSTTLEKEEGKTENQTSSPKVKASEYKVPAKEPEKLARSDQEVVEVQDVDEKTIKIRLPTKAVEKPYLPVKEAISRVNRGRLLIKEETSQENRKNP